MEEIKANEIVETTLPDPEDAPETAEEAVEDVVENEAGDDVIVFEDEEPSADESGEETAAEMTSEGEDTAAEDVIDGENAIVFEDEEPSEENAEETAEGAEASEADSEALKKAVDEDAPDLKTEVSMEEMEKNINASTDVTAREAAAGDAEDLEDEGKKPVKKEQLYGKGRTRKKTMRITIGLLIFMAALIVGAYLFLAIFFQTHFYSGTILNGMDVSGMTVEDVKGKIADKIGDYTLTLRETDRNEIITAQQVDMAYVDDGKIDELLANQDSWLFFTRLFQTKSYEFEAGTSYNKDKALKAVSNLECFKIVNIVEPKDAYIAVNDQGEAVIIPEVEGSKLDEKKVDEAVLDALDKAETSLDLEPCYIRPQIRSTDPSMQSCLEDYNAILKMTLYYTFGDNTEAIDGGSVGLHMTCDGKQIIIDEEWLTSVVESWGEKYNTFGKERKFKTHSGKEVTIPGSTTGTGEVDPATGEEVTHTSDYGWLVDTKATVDDILKALKDKESGTREPIFKYKCRGWDNKGLTKTYIEVSLEKQYMWVYNDGKVVLECNVVTGTPDDPTKATYPGCYAIDAKKTPAELGTDITKGGDGNVTYWMPFDGNRGIFDASWRGSFGGKIYRTDGSNGSVNVPATAMPKLFESIEEGTAIVIY